MGCAWTFGVIVVADIMIEWLLSESSLNNRLRLVQVGSPVQYYAFTDKGYASQSHVKAAHHGFPRPTVLENLANLIMGSCRVAVEQFFAMWKVLSVFLFINPSTPLNIHSWLCDLNPSVTCRC